MKNKLMLMMGIVVLVLVNSTFVSAYPAYLNYQETANLSTTYGLDTGSYHFEPLTKISGIGYLYVNYTKPLGATNESLWQVKHGNTTTLPYNITLPNSCWSAYLNKINFRILTQEGSILSGSESKCYCFNSTSWILIGNSYSNTIYAGSNTENSNPLTNFMDGNWETYTFKSNYIQDDNSPWYTGNTNAKNSLVYEEAMWWKISDYNYTANHTSPVLETSSQTFTLNITRNSTYIEDGNATLHWNGTEYPVDATVYDDYLLFSKTLTIPSVSTNTNITLNWSYDFWNPSNNSRETNRTEDYTQTIYNIDMDDCSTYSIVALNFSLIEESNNTSIAGDMDFTFSLVQEGLTINYSKSVTGVNSTAFCISTNEVGFTAQLQSEYTASGYNDFTYFAYDMTIDNSTNYVYYYLTNDTTVVTFTVQDQNSNDLEDAYIKVMKYDIGTGLYKTIETLKTDEQGEALGNIILDTAWYKFIIEYNGIVYLDTSATKMTTTARTFRINLLSDFFDRYTDVVYGIYSTLNYTDATGNFAFTYSDPNGDYHYGCLKVTKESLGGQTLINETCVASTAATILVNINNSGSVNGTYTAVGYVLFDDMYVLETMSRTWGHLSDVFGDEGLFYTFFILVVCIAVAIFSPKIAIILAIIGLVFTNILGFYFVNVGWLVVLIIGAVLTIYRMGDN